MNRITRLARTMVSQDKVRYRDGEFDLDLTYITPRLIAMGLPSSGYEGYYRNPIDKVAKFLDSYHCEKYLIFNLSERKYDYSKFNWQVLECGFPNHYNPPLELMIETVKLMDAWLKSDDDNVAVVHCLAGRGRTGTLIAGYLVYAGFFKTGGEALEHFAAKRSNSLRGVSYPSQRRYVQYLAEVLFDHRDPTPKRMILQSIQFNSVPEFEGGTGCRPIVQILRGMDTEPVWSSSWNVEEIRWFDQRDYSVSFHMEVFLQGDIVVHAFHSESKLASSRQLVQMMRFSFHTAFVESDILVMMKDELDGPHKDGRFPAHFAVKLKFAEPKEGQRYVGDRPCESRWKFVRPEVDKQREVGPLSSPEEIYQIIQTQRLAQPGAVVNANLTDSEKKDALAFKKTRPEDAFMENLRLRRQLDSGQEIEDAEELTEIKKVSGDDEKDRKIFTRSYGKPLPPAPQDLFALESGGYEIGEDSLTQLDRRKSMPISRNRAMNHPLGGRGPSPPPSIVPKEPFQLSASSRPRSLPGGGIRKDAVLDAVQASASPPTEKNLMIRNSSSPAIQRQGATAGPLPTADQSGKTMRLENSNASLRRQVNNLREELFQKDERIRELERDLRVTLRRIEELEDVKEGCVTIADRVPASSIGKSQSSPASSRVLQQPKTQPLLKQSQGAGMQSGASAGDEVRIRVLGKALSEESMTEFDEPRKTAPVPEVRSANPPPLAGGRRIGSVYIRGTGRSFVGPRAPPVAPASLVNPTKTHVEGSRPSAMPEKAAPIPPPPLKSNPSQEKKEADEARKKKEADEARKKKEAEEKRVAEEQRKKKEADEARKKKEAEEKRVAEEQRKKKEADEARKKKEAGEQRKKEAEEKRVAEEQRKKKEADEARKKKEAEEKRVAEEQRKKKEADEARKKKEAEEKRVAEEQRKKEAEEKRVAEEQRKKKEEEDRRRKAVEEERRMKEEQDRRRKAAEEQRRQREEDERRVAEERRKEEEARLVRLQELALEKVRKREEEERAFEEEQARQAAEAREQLFSDEPVIMEDGVVAENAVVDIVPQSEVRGVDHDADGLLPTESQREESLDGGVSQPSFDWSLVEEEDAHRPSLFLSDRKPAYDFSGF